MGVLIGVKSITVPSDYATKFTMANQTFLYQSVFDTKNKLEVPLVDIPQSAVIHNKDNFCLYP